MALQLTNPIVKCYTMGNLDPDGEFKVTFRQATTLESQARDTILFGSTQRAFGPQGIMVSGSVPWTVRQEIEVRLTIVGCEGLLNPDQSALLRFKAGKLDMTDEAFHAAWGKLPLTVAEEIWHRCLDTNPDWDFRDDDESELPPGVEVSVVE